MDKAVVLVIVLVALSGCLGLLGDNKEGGDNTSNYTVVYNESLGEIHFTNIPDNVSAVQIGHIQVGRESFDNSLKISTANLDGGNHSATFIRDNTSQTVKKISILRDENNSGNDSIDENETSPEGLVNLNNPSPYDSKWVLVDKTNPENYNSIQTAIDEAQHGQRILVAAGTYRESLVIDTNLEIYSLGNVTLLGDGSGHGIEVRDNSKVIVDGFEITGFEVGVYDGGFESNWSVRNSILRGNERGVWVRETVSEWSIERSIVTNNTIVGVVADEFYEKWVIENTMIINNENGVRVRNDESSWEMRRVSIRDNDEMNFRATNLEHSSDVRSSWIPDHQAEFRGLNMCTNIDCNGNINQPDKRPLDYYSDEETPRILRVPEDYSSLNGAISNYEQGDLILLEENIEESVDITEDNIQITGLKNSKPRISSPDQCLRINGAKNVKIQSITLANCNKGLVGDNEIGVEVRKMRITNNNYGVDLLGANGEMVFVDNVIRGNQQEDLFIAQMTSASSEDNLLVKDSTIGNVRGGNHNIGVNLIFNTIHGSVTTDDNSVINANKNYWAGGFSASRIDGFVLHGQTCETEKCYGYRYF